MPSEAFTQFERLVEEHCRPNAQSRLFSVSTGRTADGKLERFPGPFVDMGELSRDEVSTFAVEVTHHGSRRLAVRCRLEGLPFVSLKYDGRPIVPGMSRIFEVEADGRYERGPREWCGLLRIEGTELLPGPMTASIEHNAGYATAVVPVFGRVSMSTTPRESSRY